MLWFVNECMNVMSIVVLGENGKNVNLDHNKIVVEMCCTNCCEAISLGKHLLSRPHRRMFFSVRSQHISWQLSVFYALGDLSDPILDDSSFYLRRIYTTGGAQKDTIVKYFHRLHQKSHWVVFRVHQQYSVCSLLCARSYTKRPLDFASPFSSSSVFSSHSIC